MSIEQLETLARYLVAHRQTVVSAESCTGGLLAATLSSLPGSSQWYQGGFVTYRVEAKVSMLDIDKQLLDTMHPVSEATAQAMAQHAQAQTPADYAVATTGLAGPDDDGTGVPLGTLWIAWCGPGETPVVTKQFRLDMDRHAFRQAATDYAVEGLLTYLGIAH